jgi:uncharacterized CHY-type Zn-finger protein
MCKHIMNAQVSIRAPCCKRWFDCPECHEEVFGEDHELLKAMEFVFACKKCKKTFRKDVSEYEEADEFCPHCDNHYVIEAKTRETEGKLVIEFEQKKGHENKMFKDDREKDRAKVLDYDGLSDDLSDDDF